MNVEKWLSDGFKFGFNFRRAGAWAIFFTAAFLVFAVAAVLIGVANYAQMTRLLAQNPAGFDIASSGVAFQISIAMIIIGIATGLFFVLLSLTTYLAARDFVSTGSASLRKSFAEAKTRYLGFLAGLVLTIAISYSLMLLRLIPSVIGILLYILAAILVGLSLSFWSTYYACRGLSAIESLKASFELFKRKPLAVAITLLAYVFSVIVLVIAWLVLILLSVLIGGLLTLAFAPLGILFLVASLAFFFLFGIGFFILFQTGFMTSAFFELDAVEKKTTVEYLPSVKPPVLNAVERTPVKRVAAKKKAVRKNVR
ncbi:MAG: hypothetical protein V1811_02750 [Candidatus Micrarchaeota archaeon]